MTFKISNLIQELLDKMDEYGDIPLGRIYDREVNDVSKMSIKEIDGRLLIELDVDLMSLMSQKAAQAIADHIDKEFLDKVSSDLTIETMEPDEIKTRKLTTKWSAFISPKRGGRG